MTNLHTRRRRVAGVLAVLTAAASITLATGSSPANAAAPGTPPNHPVTMTPGTGDSGTDFKLAIDGVDQFCAGDGVAG
ncbi:MAG TPA: hypothetical protein VMM60_04375, partial [Ilumatobacter sp.]|nr:hypothetical protein [Ilumatobacter sp.]